MILLTYLNGPSIPEPAFSGPNRSIVALNRSPVNLNKLHMNPKTVYDLNRVHIDPKIICSDMLLHLKAKTKKQNNSLIFIYFIYTHNSNKLQFSWFIPSKTRKYKDHPTILHHHFGVVTSSETFDSEVRVSALCSHEVTFVGVSDSVTSTDGSV